MSDDIKSVLSVGVCDSTVQMENMSTESVPRSPAPPSPSSRLLMLPEGVNDVLLSFVATGTGGLKGLLSLREVCSTTKLWVDGLPGRQGVSTFSRAQVRMDSDVATRRRFLEAPPPFAVTSLSLNIAGLYEKKISRAEEEAWKNYYNFWAPRLETLELRGEGHPPSQRNLDRHQTLRSVEEMNQRTLDLLDSPNLHHVTSNLCFNSKRGLNCQLKFLRSEELQFAFHYYLDFIKTTQESKKDTWFYSHLDKIRNLKQIELNFVIGDVSELESVGKFIEAKKDDEDLEISLGMHRFPPRQTDVDVEEGNSAFVKFAKILLASKSKIRLRLNCQREMIEEFNLHEENDTERDSLQTAKDLLGGKDFWEFVNLVEEIIKLKPNEDSLSLIQHLPKLSSLERLLIEPSRLEELTFPSNVVSLGFRTGIPTVGGLPATLTSLKLCEISTCTSELVRFLNLLSDRCSSLETLLVNWQCDKELSSTEKFMGNLGRSKMFQKLRVLHFTGYVNKTEQQKGVVRDVLVNGLNVGALQLLHLTFVFKAMGCEMGHIRVMDEEILTGLSEGEVASSLLAVDISKEMVTAGGQLLLLKLTSLAEANRRKRGESEGRGEWQRRYPLPGGEAPNWLQYD